MKTYLATVQEIEKELAILITGFAGNGINIGEFRETILKYLSRIRHQTLQEVRERMPKKRTYESVQGRYDVDVLDNYNQALSDIHQVLKEMEK